MAVLHTIRKIPYIFDPTILPSAISGFLLRAAITLAANSGRDVPIATIVRPMIDSGTPSPLAILVADVTSICHHPTSPAIPSTININAL